MELLEVSRTRWKLRVSSATCTAARRRTELNGEVTVPTKWRRHKGLRHANNYTKDCSVWCTRKEDEMVEKRRYGKLACHGKQGDHDGVGGVFQQNRTVAWDQCFT